MNIDSRFLTRPEDSRTVGLSVDGERIMGLLFEFMEPETAAYGVVLP